MLTNEVTLYSSCRRWPISTPKWHDYYYYFYIYFPPTEIFMVYTWHCVGLEVWVRDALWALCFTHCDNESAALGVLSHPLNIFQVTVFDLLCPCSSALCRVAQICLCTKNIKDILHLVCQHFLWRWKFHVNNLLFIAIVVQKRKCLYLTATLFWAPRWWWLRLCLLNRSISKLAKQSRFCWEGNEQSKAFLCSVFRTTKE